MGGIVDQAHVAGHGGDPGRGGELLGGDLVAHGLDGLDRRADEGDPCGGQRLGELGALRQEAVARMHRLRPARLHRLEDAVDDDVGLAGRRRADMHRLVGHAHVQRRGVGVGKDGDGADFHAARRLDDPAGDLAAVGDQDLVEHR